MSEQGRSNQRRRTRKDLLQAAGRLMKQGKTPSLEEIAAEAMVSRATAYRYFPNVEALLVEAPLDLAIPEPEELFRDAPAHDPEARIGIVNAAFETMMAANEAPLRVMLSQTVQRPLRDDDEAPRRQNRRTPLIEAALAPAQAELKRPDMLAKALALVIGTESMIVFKDVLQAREEEASAVRRWMIRALVKAARE